MLLVMHSSEDKRKRIKKSMHKYYLLQDSGRQKGWKQKRENLKTVKSKQNLTHDGSKASKETISLSHQWATMPAFSGPMTAWKWVVGLQMCKVIHYLHNEIHLPLSSLRIFSTSSSMLFLSSGLRYMRGLMSWRRLPLGVLILWGASESVS